MQKNQMKGYNKIAALMGRYPESAIISQFSELNIQNLLYLQAELIGLQKDLRELEDANDRSSDPERSAYSRNWDALSSAKKEGGSNEQWKLVQSINVKLKEYSACVYARENGSEAEICRRGRLPMEPDWDTSTSESK
jgi:hypothetical protein